MDEVKQEEIDFLVNWFENSSYEEIDDVLDKVINKGNDDKIITVT